MFGPLCLVRAVGEGMIVSALNVRAALWVSKKRGDQLTLTIFDGQRVRQIAFRVGEEIAVFEHFTLEIEVITSLGTFENMRWVMRAAPVYRIARAEIHNEEPAVA